MADTAGDVLVLEDELIEPETDEQDQPDESEQSEDTGEQETVIGFDDDEEAPPSESDNSTIREMRRQLREATRERDELKRSQEPKPVEVGPEPELGDENGWDEERWKADWKAWDARRQAAEGHKQKVRQAEQEQQAAFDKVQTAYVAEKATLGIANFDDVEAEVTAALPASHQGLLLRSGKGAALIAALSRSPSKLEELSKLEPTEAAMMIGELRSKLHMGTRKAPSPDRPVKGNAAPANADKELARLEKEADRTGDRTEVIRYKRQLRNRA